MAPGDAISLNITTEENSVSGQPTLFQEALDRAKVDLAPKHRQPSTLMVLVAAIASVLGSLAADAALVALGTAVFPSTKGYVHFQFSDYAKLTIIGVVVASAAWPIVTRISSAPRWLYFRLAIVVTIVLLAPDAWILLNGAPTKAVAVLVTMHLAIAVVTYNCMVRIAPVREMRVQPIRSS